MCAEDVVLMCTMMSKLGFSENEPATIYYDSKTAIARARNKHTTHNTGINTKYKQVREWVHKMDVILVQCSNLNQRADIIPLARPSLQPTLQTLSSTHVSSNDQTRV